MICAASPAYLRFKGSASAGDGHDDDDDDDDDDMMMMINHGYHDDDDLGRDYDDGKP